MVSPASKLARIKRSSLRRTYTSDLGHDTTHGNKSSECKNTDYYFRLPPLMLLLLLLLLRLLLLLLLLLGRSNKD